MHYANHQSCVFFYINKTNEIYYPVLILLGKFYLYTESTKKCDKKSLFSVLKFKKKITKNNEN